MYDIKFFHGTFNRSARTQPVRYIVIHYTGAGSSAAGCALANCRYFAGGDRQASAHYFIDDANIYEYADPAKYYTWHCGDGHGRYGISNGNSIGIEVCSSGADYTPEELSRLHYLVRLLMNRFRIDPSHVVRHYDASRKACPWPYVPNGGDPTEQKWRALHSYITEDINDSDRPAGSASAESHPVLTVDGILGPQSIARLQAVLGSPYVDGVISGQYKPNQKFFQAINPACVTWESNGSTMVRLLQQRVGASMDGILGPGTVKCIQRYLGGLQIDGYLGPTTAKRIQSRLNEGRF